MIKKTKKACAPKCAQCQTRRKEELEAQDFSFAVLVSLVPLLVFTLFGQIGLF